jgi:hypothetical protein
VIEHIQQSGILSRSDPKVALAYVYFDYKDRARQSPENVLAELIKQLEFQLVDTINDTPPLPHIEIMYQHLHNNGKRPALFDLKHSFHTISRQFEKIYLVFEALDECDEQTRSIVLFSLLEGLPFTPRGTNVFKLFVTARPYRANIQSSLGPEILQLPIAADMGDMELAARGKIAVAKQKGVIIYPQLEEDIVSAVLEKAAGMYVIPGHSVKVNIRTSAK